MKNITLLMTGAGAPGAPGIIKCLKSNGERNIKIIGLDIKKQVSTALMLDGFYTIKPPTDPSFTDDILAIAKKENAQVIMPLVTKELNLFSKNKDYFASNGIQVCVSPLSNLEIANDKGKLLDFLVNAGIRTPEYIKIATIAEFKKACRNLGYPQTPVCFKPSVSNGSRGFRIIDPTIDRAKILFNEKPTALFIAYDEIISILSTMDKIPELLVMEFLSGQEYSVDILADNGRLIIAVPRKRIAMNGGISTNCINENNPEITDYCETIVAALKLDGNIGIQVRADKNGQYKILEINPRVQGSIVSCLASGINLPYLAVKKILGETFDMPKVKYPVEMLRYWNEVYFDETGHAFAL